MELAARIGTMAATAGGLPFEKIVIENASANCAAWATEINRLLGGINACVIAVGDEFRNNQPVAALLAKPDGVAINTSVCRMRNGDITRALATSDYDADSRVGDEYWVIPVPFSTEGGGTKCLTPRRSYRRLARPSARFCSHSQEWEVAA